MQNVQKRNSIKLILILGLFTLTFPILLLYILLRDFQVFISIFDTYLTSGNSFFLPFIPYINFLPEESEIIHFTLGQLIDLIIIFNIIPWIESCVYHYVKVTCLRKELQLTIDLKPYLFGKIYEPSQDSNKYEYDFFANINTKQLVNFTEKELKRFTNLFSHVIDKSLRRNLFQNRRLHKKSKNPQGYSPHCVFEIYGIFNSIKSYHFPLVNNSTNSIEMFVMEAG